MGKLEIESPQAGAGVHALHNQPGPASASVNPVSVEDDAPPLYDEAVESASAPLLSDNPYELPAQFEHDPSLPALQPFRCAESGDYYLDSRIDHDPSLLEKLVRNWAAKPPRPFVRLYGQHTERKTKERDGRSENTNVTDFDIKLDLTPYLHPPTGTRWENYELCTVENDEKAKRGSVFRKRAPGYSSSYKNLTLLSTPTITEWCHMYCASHAELKVFQLKRKIIGFDKDRFKKHIERLVSKTNYRGHLRIEFPIQNEVTEVWNDCKMNHWRQTKWIYAVFYITMLWILAWPYLFLRTKKYETVSSVWHYSRLDWQGKRSYATISEDQVFNIWSKAISRAVLSRRQGCLDQEDLLAAEGENILDVNPSGWSLRLGGLNLGNWNLGGWGEDEY